VLIYGTFPNILDVVGCHPVLSSLLLQGYLKALF
jgi:hypothetical protein